MDFLTLASDVGFPIAGALAAGYFVFLTMNNDLVKIDALLSYALNVRPNIDRIAANEGKDDARKD